MTYYITYDSTDLLNLKLEAITFSETEQYTITNENILAISSALVTQDLLILQKSFIINEPDFFYLKKSKIKHNHILHFLNALNKTSYDVIFIATKQINPNYEYISLVEKKLEVITIETNKQSIAHFFNTLIKYHEIKIAQADLDQIYLNQDNDILATKNELLKLAAFDPNITSTTINAIGSKSIKSSSFDLATFIIQDQKVKARNLFTTLISEGNDPISILGLLTTQFEFFITVKIGTTKKYEALLNQLNYHPYRIKQTSQVLRFIQSKTLYDHYLNISNLDYLVKSGNLSQDYLIDMILYPQTKEIEDLT